MENQEQQQFQQQNQGKKGKKSILLLVLLLLLVTVTVGYAVLSTSFNIRGASKVIGGEWCIDPRGCGDDKCENIETCDNPPIVCEEGENCEITDCDVEANADKCNCDAQGNCEGPNPIDCTVNPEKCTKPNCEVTPTEDCVCESGDTNCIPNPQIWMNGNTIEFRHILTKPGDEFIFNATFKNEGDIDAKLSNVTKSELNNTAKQYLTYDVTYSDGSAVSVNDPLNAGSSVTYKVKVAYKSTVTNLPDQATLDLINEKAQGNYGATSLFTATYEQK